MPYCPKCGDFYYIGTSHCSTCGRLLTGPREPDSGFKPARKQQQDKPCQYCHSTGKVDQPVGGSATTTCPVCKGRRHNLIPEDWQWCRMCFGSGELTYGNSNETFRKPCPECNGTGWAKSRYHPSISGGFYV